MKKEKLISFDLLIYYNRENILYLKTFCFKGTQEEITNWKIHCNTNQLLPKINITGIELKETK